MYGKTPLTWNQSAKASFCAKNDGNPSNQLAFLPGISEGSWQVHYSCIYTVELFVKKKKILLVYLILFLQDSCLLCKQHNTVPASPTIIFSIVSFSFTGNKPHSISSNAPICSLFFWHDEERLCSCTCEDAHMCILISVDLILKCKRCIYKFKGWAASAICKIWSKFRRILALKIKR